MKTKPINRCMSCDYAVMLLLDAWIPIMPGTPEQYTGGIDGNPISALGYTGVYAFANVLLTVAGSVILLLQV